MSERDPLLARRLSGVSNADTEKKRAWHLNLLPSFKTISPRYKWVPLLGCTLIFINEAEYFVKQVATMRAIESMYCYNHYLARGSDLAGLGKHIPEHLCKDDSVQKDLARTAGLIMFVRMLSAMLGAVPLGYVADRWGRKVVVVMHKVNVVVSCSAWLACYLAFPKVPIWMLYLSGLPGLFGGNFDVGLAMLFASYTDVMPSATERASLFFLTTSMQFLAQTFCPLIGAWLMNLDGKSGTPQVNLAVSLGMSMLTALIAIFLWPETFHESKAKPSDTEHGSSSTTSQQEEDPKSQQGNPMSNFFQARLFAISNSISGIGILNICFLSLSIMFAATGIKAIDWYGLVQYPVIKLRWSFPQASSIVSVQGVLMLAHFSVVLPVLNSAAARYFGSSGHGHFAIMAGSALLLTLGSMVIGFSTSTFSFVVGVIIFLFGEGLPTATQAFIVSLVEKKQVAKTMATLSTTSIFGKLCASLFFPKVLSWGLDSKVEMLVGLPFFASAALFASSGLCFTVVGVKIWREQKGQVT
ncbi:ATP phosphoribosyltransferase [Venturia nashicola]|uniref:ATP phosphoribosyltransferase n=1 Tax=Venturia nashicola TaxID=86259 RepID=A0A4Z1PM52_9PEZI|nr:ATP phosphoribosyltransferase [Venturia nashicola]TLD39015.1 ATP phosphoribosyltransferase [Venturia nashicola]